MFTHSYVENFKKSYSYSYGSGDETEGGVSETEGWVDENGAAWVDENGSTWNE
jgi:hypothetical protein